jgi:poly [ADP-ribose] polymerase
MLILVDTVANSNKFYKLELDATGRVSKTYGRVGAAGVTNYEMTGDHGFDTILNAKKRKGYREVDVAGDTPKHAGARVDNARLHAVAKSGLTSGKAKENVDIDRLIERIVRVNAHQILESSGGMMKVDTSGRIQTPLGIVTGTSIARAEALLGQLSVAGPADLPRLLEQYLTCVPQKVGSRAGWADTFFNAENTIQKQRDFLQQLRDSLNFYDAQAVAAATAPADAAADAGFKYKIRAVSSTGATFKRIEKLYESSKADFHAASRLRLKRVFELVDPAGAKVYEKIASEIGNRQELWHGTKAVNLLSILRKGLYIPPTSGTTIQIAGRMFGDGLYLSSLASKSLGYATGLWGGNRETNCFMLLNDVAMGSEYRPTRNGFDPAIPREARSTLNKFGKPFNSINVRAGSGGVRNPESIVWNVDQVRVRYLCEFDA